MIYTIQLDEIIILPHNLEVNTVLYTYPTVSLHKFDILFDKTSDF